ncbi:transcriptional regulator, AraC family [Pseudooceanicola antarcticus]|uniref:AraC family transcriptional regulator n=1 Tax=Pseudooceanicola antarcticus TaxID=1247613 RepID=A0A285IHF6_9RHOB|nr:AraC family transcriptional regulator [Pseudooceanicola antarcticus]PJE28978.1 AraC family transcriptional regulator [Pseudooceanicola antarcticus]SNY47399.1 transcriptional regulator, AraC family [Pseudooceanicola antarcticus]
MSAPVFQLLRGDFPAAPPRSFRQEAHYLLHASDGVMRMEAKGQLWTLPPARAALVAAGEEITIALPRRLQALSVLIPPEAAPAPPAPLRVFESSPLLRALLAEMPEDDSDPTHARALGAALISTAWRLAARPLPLSRPVGRSAMVQRALALVEARLEDPPEIPELARELATTPRTLARHLQAETGMGWRDLMRRMRVMRAAELLCAPDMPVIEVALACGYGSLSGFNTGFREITGQSPRDYRRSLAPR